MSNVVPFTGQGGRVFYPSRQEIEVKGKPQRHWIVLVREPNDDENLPIRGVDFVCRLLVRMRRRDYKSVWISWQGRG